MGTPAFKQLWDNVDDAPGNPNWVKRAEEGHQGREEEEGHPPENPNKTRGGNDAPRNAHKVEIVAGHGRRCQGGERKLKHPNQT